MLQKLYGANPEETRYSPAKIIGVRSEVIRGNPNPKHISTSYVERQNLTMRMSMRRFARLTNGLSNKLENHAAAVALHYMHSALRRSNHVNRRSALPASDLNNDFRFVKLEHIAEDRMVASPSVQV